MGLFGVGILATLALNARRRDILGPFSSSDFLEAWIRRRCPSCGCLRIGVECIRGRGGGVAGVPSGFVVRNGVSGGDSTIGMLSRESASGMVGGTRPVTCLMKEAIAR